MSTWGTIKAFFYVVVFGIAAYAVAVNDRDLIKVVAPVVFLITGWWIWKDLRSSIERWQKDRETPALIIRQRIDQLEDRVTEIENLLHNQRD